VTDARRNPYLLDTPAVVSFSGGRTSGYMLYHILEAFGGTLPDNLKVIFCNTGKERPETLDFVERCSQRWGVPVVWLEYRFVETGGVRVSKRREGHTAPAGDHSWAVVDYATASRNGEPFEAIIRARNFLPNMVARFCTTEMKILTNHRYLKSLGWLDWTNAIGLRADEPQRVARNRSGRHIREEMAYPLFNAGVTEPDVLAFWNSQPFDLDLQTHEGNCDLCFLKGAGKIQRIMQDRPDLADWWIRMEQGVARLEADGGGTGRFRRDRPSYAKLLELSQRPGLFDATEDDELSISCHCTD